MLRAMLALAATGMTAQIATSIHFQDVRFKGDTRLDGVDLKKCASDLKSQVYVGTTVPYSLYLTRVRSAARERVISLKDNSTPGLFIFLPKCF